MSNSELKIEKVIKAGAGAGKTTTLINELYSFYHAFLKYNKKEPHVVVTTFTKKATQELQERLLKKAVENNDKYFLEYINKKSKLHISTIHGVLHTALSQYADDFELSNHFEIITDSEDHLMKEVILKTLFKKSSNYDTLLDEYTFSDLISFCSEYEEKCLIDSSLHPYSSLEFKKVIENHLNEAIKNLNTGLELLDSQKLSESWRKWVDSIKLLKFKDPSISSGLLSAQSFYENIQNLIHWRQNNGRKPTLSRGVKNEHLFAGQEKISEAITLIDYLEDNYYFQDNLIEDYEIYMSLLEKLGKAFIQQRKLEKFKNFQITLGDLEWIFYNRFLNSANNDFLKSFIDKWDLWMVDEYQDTSPLQEMILKYIISDRSHFYVGDPQQSIYLFRGANSEIFINAYKKYSEQGKAHELMVNYRSSKGVLNFINQFFQFDPTQFKEMLPHRESSKQLTDVECVVFAEELPSFKIISQYLLKLTMKSPELHEIAVLSRTNKELRSLEDEIKKLNIPYYLHESGRFFQKREIIDVLQFIKFLLNPHNDINLIALLRSPWIGASDDEILIIQEEARRLGKMSLFSHFQKINQTQHLEFLQRLLYFHELKNAFGFLYTLEKFIFSSGFFICAQENDPSGKMESNLWKIYDWIKDVLTNPKKDLLKEITILLDDISKGDLSEVESTSIVELKKVQLMTIHASKGLQFKYVILLGSDSGFRSSSKSQFFFSEEKNEWSFCIKEKYENKNIVTPFGEKLKIEIRDREMLEYWRLLYVALTRAKEQIILFSSKKAIKSNSVSWSKKFSEFFERLPGKSDFVDSTTDFRYNIHSMDTEEDLKNFLTAETPSGAENHAQTSEVSAINSLKFTSENNLENIENSLVENLKFPRIFTLEPVNSSTRSVSEFKKSTLGDVLNEIKGVENHLKLEVDLTLDQKLTNVAPQFPWKEIIARGNREFGFIFNFNSHLIKGRIDFWSIYQNQVYIIDYKTGLKELDEDYFFQLCFYAESLKYMNLFETREVNLFLFYTLKNKIVEKKYQCAGNLDQYLRPQE